MEQMEEKAFLEAFIERYKTLPCLWDTSTEDYADREKRDEGYKELLIVYKKFDKDATIGDVKRKINTLRTNRRRELKKIISSASESICEEEVYIPTIWWFNLLDFLGNVVKLPSNFIMSSYRSEEKVKRKMTIYWTRHNTETLIVLLKEERCLWDTSDPEYNIKKSRTAAQNRIRKSMKKYIPGIALGDIRYKIQSVRSQFRRQLNVIEANMRNRGGKEQTPILWCFDKLRFLIPKYKNSILQQLSPTQNLETHEKQNAIDWSRTNTRRLITLWKEKPELWDANQPGYPDKEKRQAAYKAIRHALKEFLPHIKIMDISNRLNNIRGQFRKELSYMRKNQDSNWVPRLWCFDQLKFLGPILDKDCWSQINLPNDLKNAQDTSNVLLNSESMTETPCTSRQTKSNSRLVSKKNQENDSCEPTASMNENLREHCRICLSSISTLPVIIPSRTLEFFQNDLKFTYLAASNLRSDLPQNVCSECYSNIVQLQRFYDQCLNANEFLKEKLEALVKEEIIDVACRNEPMIVYEKDETTNITNRNEGSDIMDPSSEEHLHTDFLEDEMVMECKYDEDANETHETAIDVNDLNSYICDNVAVMETESVFTANVNAEEKFDPSSEAKEDVTDSEESEEEKPFACKNCGKTFKRKTSLRSHELIHTNSKQYVCYVCGRCFRQCSTLNTHLTQHFGKPFECEECGRKFARRTQMNLHRQRHRNDFPFRCDFEGCTAAFIHQVRLKDHKLTHSNLRPHICEICSCGFKLRRGLVGHMKQVHPSMVYSCPECDECKPTTWDIRQHMRTAHDIILEDVSHLKMKLPERPQRRRGIRKSIAASQKV